MTSTDVGLGVKAGPEVQTGWADTPWTKKATVINDSGNFRA